MKYTDILDKIKNIKMLCLISNMEILLNEMIGIINIAVNNDIAGVIYDNEKFIISMDSNVLLKSFKASLKGCRIPVIPTLLGPFRNWIYPKIFRSKIV